MSRAQGEDSIKAYMRQDLRDFRPYHAPIKPYVIKVDANETPFEHSPTVIEKMKAWVEEKDNLTRYPDTDCHALRDKIAAFYGKLKEEVICGVGSDQLIELILKVFLEPGDKILAPNPSFSMYGLSTLLNHGQVVNYELGEDFLYDTELLLQAYKVHQPKIVFICTPNNPTGSMIAPDDMRYLLEVIKCPVVVDEAYEEYISASMIDDIHNYPQLIVLRTFSKAFGLAGLRVGYGLANAEMIEIINTVRPPYNLSAFSQAVAGFVLDDAEFYMKKVHQIISIRDDFMHGLTSCGCFEKVFPSVANFVLVKLKDKDPTKFLAAHQVLIRDYGPTGRLAQMLRFTIGTQEENNRVLELLNIFSQGGESWDK